ncbi:protein transport protein Sec24C [Epargyreus clarus]|uniref:protein transport protein Sec24C n=1 Tax=Epargyreus clarus TaxID=520877 RepID=UPI003C2CE1AC
MMNPQYPPPGQNNNAPNNPLGFPPASQDFNGVHNANIFNQMPPNGPQMPMKPFDQSDVAQKMQSMNLNGPQGHANIPSSQLPPGQVPPGGNLPPNFGGQLPPGMKPNFQPGRPPVSSTPQQFPPSMGQSIPSMPPSSTPTPISSQPQGFAQMPPHSQGSNDQRGFHGPPTSMPLQQGPPKPMSQAPPMNQGPPPGFGPSHGQGPQMPPQSQAPSGMPPQGGPMGRQSGPSQAEQPKPGAPMMGGPPQQGFSSMPPTSQPGGPSQPGFPPMPPTSQPGGPQQPGFPPMPPSSQPGAPPQQNQPGLPPQMRSGQPGMPQQGQMPPQAGFPQNRGPQGMNYQGMPGQPPMPGQGPQQPGLMQNQGLPLQPQSGMPPQPGQMGPPGQLPMQPGLPGQPGFPQQPSMQSKLGPQPGQPGLPQQPGLPPQPGLPQQPGLQPGLPQQPGHQPGLPQQPGLQPGLPQQPGLQPGIPQQPGLPPQPGMPPSTQAQFNQYQTMPGLPHMPPPLSQQRQFPGGPPQPGYGPPPATMGPQPNAPYPGMPPMNQQMGGQGPGYQQTGYPPYGQQQYAQQYAQQPQQKRLDPDQMPSPIQVMLDDQQNRGGVFVTNDKGLVPPLVTTDFVVDDKGNASPRYIRSSMYSVPVTADLLKQTSLPFCLVISPMAEPVGTEQEPPLLDFAALTGSPTMGPVRCSRCKAYICPNMKFIDAGRHFKCAFCKATTEVPMEYTQYINSMQQYGRVPAELALGAYEIVATKEYCRNNTLPNPPAVVFVIDVSYNAVKNGLVQTVCDNIMDIIESMPKDEKTGKTYTRVGFITYSSTVHFYNIKETLAQPQMLSVGDVGDMFVPLLEGFLAPGGGPVLQALLKQLPTLVQDNRETETVLLPAVQAGLEALKAADTSGQLIVFHTTLPTYNAPGKLVNREDRKLLGTDKEKQILSPQTTAYNELGQACSAAGVCVELFVCNNAYVDAATIGQLARLTGGQLHKYTYFSADTDGARLSRDVKRAVSRPAAHDAVMRVRTSTGVRATDFYGHFFMANTTDVELAAIDADKAIGVEIKHDDKLTGEDGVYIQAALLYTRKCGQRRLRVLNLALAVAHQLADVYRSAELDTTLNFLTKQAVWALRDASPRAVREALSSRCARSLAAYRKHCASPSSAGQLVLPESMKLLPLYTSCVLRSDAVAGGPDITCDDRSCAMYRALTADVSLSVVYTYPRLLPLHTLPAAPPTPLRASVDKMHDQGVYLLENGVHMLVWVGSQAPADFVRDVFGAASPQQIDTQVCELPILDNPTSEAVRELIEDARVKRRNAMRLTLMRQHDKLEAVLRHFLVEDRGVDGSSSYVDYLCHIHKEIRALL